jgi:sugar phosphate isomerase/epimerase
VIDGLRFGMPSLIELEGIEAQVEACARLGLDFVELNMNLPYCVPERLDPAALRALARGAGVAITLHLPEEIDLASFQPPIREAHRRVCAEAIRWAAQAGIAVANMHLLAGVYFTLPDRRVWLYERYAAELRQALAESFAALDAEAARAGVLLCVENTGDWDRAWLTEALEGVLATTAIGLTWDTGHDGAAEFRDRPFLRRHQDRIRHMHLHDFRSGRSHLELGRGELDIDAALAVARERDAAVVVETKTLAALEASLAVLRAQRAQRAQRA